MGKIISLVNPENGPLWTPDDTPENQDWTKTHWDLPTNRTDLLDILASMQITVEAFKALPVYKNAVGHMPWLRDL